MRPGHGAARREIMGSIGRAANGIGSTVDANTLRVLIAKLLDVAVDHVTDTAHLTRDLGADWLDRLELIILVEEFAGVEIPDHEADRIEFVIDLIQYIDESGIEPRPRLNRGHMT
jgi:acyl carrier protein